MPARLLVLGAATVAVAASLSAADPRPRSGLVVAAAVGPGFSDRIPADVRTPADIAVAKALAQVGKPYRYGGRGPDAFDCSGLVGYSWAAAGVELPRSSGAQFAALPQVPLDELRPGDLVYSPGHIGMFVGDQLMVHAPRTGRRVEVAPLHRNVRGAVRPDGLVSPGRAPAAS
jgi:cell wall-associated NlpC family hydrolase